MKSPLAWLVLAHRYLGFALCVPIAIWFASGVAMMYGRDMPRLTSEMRLRHLAPVEIGRVRLSPPDALARAGMPASLDRLTLLTVLDRPAYRAGDVTVFADTGERLPAVDERTALAVASRFTGLAESRLRYRLLLTEPDQWTLAERRRMPLHRIDADDAAGTVLYVSGRLAEVVVITTSASRRLAAIGAIPHWIYFRALRVRATAWRQTVLWLSALAALSALIGLVVGVMRIRRTPPRSPYAGAMKWHHVAGLVFGVFTLTWIVSGFLSMQPWDWASDTGGIDDTVARALEGGPLDLPRFPPLDRDRWARTLPPAKEIAFARVHGSPAYLVRFDDGHVRVVPAETLEMREGAFDDDSLVARVREALPGTPIVTAERLDRFDAYYYSRDAALPLPVLRLTLADPRRTWLYIDPATSLLKATFSRRARLERWLYHGLHSLDFGFWYFSRPAWDIGVIALLAGGFVVSGLGVILTVRRAVRAASRRRGPT